MDGRLFKVTEHLDLEVHYEIQAKTDEEAFDIYLKSTELKKLPVEFDNTKIDRAYIGRDVSCYERTEDITPYDWENEDDDND
tara:strand:+ start:5454 stop:5699 length:246 start_codon:yes stop_codon:yes gene_type:complete